MTSGASPLGGRARGGSNVNARTDPSRLQKAAMAVAAAFTLIGILGFIPGIVTDYDTLKFAGHHGDAELLGLFHISVLHNIVHLLFGLVGFALARTWNGARSYLIGSGVIYLVLALYGALIDKNSKANFVPIDKADNWLHLLLGLGMLALGLLLGRRRATADVRR
jgi:hypothetical protein